MLFLGDLDVRIAIKVAGYRATGNEGKAQEPLPIGAGCHEKLPTQQKLRLQNSVAGIVPAFK
jgi:hypothetical protein